MLKYPVAFLLMLMFFWQVSFSNQIEQMVHIVTEADKNMAETICAKTEDLRTLKDGTTAPMVFIGKWEPELPAMYVRPWDATGISFFTIDTGELSGAARISRFMRSMGLRAPEPSMENLQIAKECAETMPVWPEEGSYVLKDGVLVVKLSEP